MLISIMLVLYEPTSVFKCEKAIKANVLDKITYIVPNFEEVKALAYALKGTHFGGDVKRCAHLLLEYGVKHVIVKLGPNGVFVASHDKTHLYCPALKPKEVVNVSRSRPQIRSTSILTRRLYLR